MSVFKDEMYKYITSSENFELAADLNELFPEVKERLITEFWEIVCQQTQQLDSEKEWVIEIEDNSLYIYKEAWNCFVEVNQLRGAAFYGLNCDDDVGIDMDKARDLLQKNDALDGFKRSRDWLMHKNRAWVDFASTAGMKKLLPEVRDTYAQSIAKELYEFANNTMEDMKKISTFKVQK